MNRFWKDFQKVITFNGFFILIGVFGGLASIIAIFFDLKSLSNTINAGWLVLELILTAAFVFALIKVILNLYKEIDNKTYKPFSTKIIKFIPKDDIFLISSDPDNDINYNTVVSFYYEDNDYSTPMGYGYVFNKQEKIIQIKMLDLINTFKENKTIMEQMVNNNYETINKIKIKPYLDYRLVSLSREET